MARLCGSLLTASRAHGQQCPAGNAHCVYRQHTQIILKCAAYSADAAVFCISSYNSYQEANNSSEDGGIYNI